MLLALLVLFSTVSFTIEKHFCGDVLIDVAVFTEAQKCVMEAFEKEQEAITKKTCCKDEVKLVKGQDELKVSTFDDLTLLQQLFITTFTYTFINLFEGLETHIIPHKDYSPPNLVVDIQVLDQVFII
ncbi:hypothetical protein VP395_14320 [Mariniflexile soesokkakense]|uniref:Secreted protein n=1 Tax=Mariniflexile soesokkakense TaxID=1343160 RepID=A0ABV0AED5_9FLAO